MSFENMSFIFAFEEKNDVSCAAGEDNSFIFTYEVVAIAIFHPFQQTKINRTLDDRLMEIKWPIFHIFMHYRCRAGFRNGKVGKL